MKMQLTDLWTEKNPQNADLQRLMLMCKTEAQVIYMVCVGAGDAFIARYWHTLQKHVNQNRLHLLVADKKSLRELADEKVRQARESGEVQAADSLEESYGNFIKSSENKSNVKFVNINDENDRPWYDHIRADIVLVLVPDDFHVEVAKEWLKRSTLILIEKPYNRHLAEAVEFEAELKSMTERFGGNVPATCVCAFDHYLAKISEYVFQKERHLLLERIGRLTRIDFSILEAGPIEPWRAKSLRAGMIYDLFSHVLAMISVELDLSSFRNNEVERILVARHKQCPDGFSADTFAHFDFSLLDYHGRRIKVNGSIGKGVGKIDQKVLTFVGEFGSITSDLSSKGSKGIFIREDRGSGINEPIYAVLNGHKEFLEALLTGRYIDEPMGGISGSTAIEILRIMNSIRDKIPTSIYQPEIGDDEEAIIEKATQLRFR